MKITNLRTNHITNPIGYDFAYLYFTWEVSEVNGKQTSQIRIQIWDDVSFTKEHQVYDSKEIKTEQKHNMKLSLPLKPRTRYYWIVSAVTDVGEKAQSEPAFFETGKREESWQAEWIGAKETLQMPYLFQNLSLKKQVKEARVYCCGFGLYELYIDEQKISDEYLMPGYFSYDLLQEYQTFDVTENLRRDFDENKEHTIGFLLGEGWYKGRFVFEGGFRNLYGDQKKVIAELQIQYEDGTTDVIKTNESWKARTSFVQMNNIYDGEIQDRTCENENLAVTVLPDSKEKLQERTSVPLKIVEKKKPVKLLITPKGEHVLDFGEMISGWVTFEGELKQGEAITLQYGELLQDDCFYRDNLRTAKAEFTYVSDGVKRKVRPHFTYYGFRYVKVMGVSQVEDLDFTACRMMSDCKANGTLQTSDKNVNQLIQNAIRSQKCNFLDIPTDCPQRDERMGWTGDIGVFADTACLNAECAGFFRHYLTTLRAEQKEMKGSIPFFAPYPKVAPREGLNPFLMSNGACTWGDAATILPWTIYEHYQDVQLLEEFYPMMWDWTMYEKQRAIENEIPYLWQNDRQLGDWLALDNGNIHNPIGATDPGYIASAYYYYSTCLTLNAAEVLERKEDADILRKDKEKIRMALQQAYFNSDGILEGKETQTGYALALAFGILEPNQGKNAVKRLKELITEKDNHLDTGFVGTAFLLQALSQYDENELAYKLLLQDSYPSWLYEVKLGATSIWERWNSLLEDGKISGTEMNSMNHYAYGSVISWIYRYACGFMPCLKERQTLKICPKPSYQLKAVSGTYGTPWGTYEASWEYIKETQIRFHVKVPYDGVAFLSLPGQFEQHLTAGEYGFVLNV